MDGGDDLQLLHTLSRLRVEADSGHKDLDGTPAMAAGLIEHVWTMQELLRYQVSLPE